MAIQGSCLCHSVKYVIEGELGPIVCCHCSSCRKVNGTAFATGTPIDAGQLTILSGAETMKSYESSPGVHRWFCGNCGAPVYSRRDAQPNLLRMRLGLLDTKITAKPAMHIFVGDKAEWSQICDDAPQYETTP
ncbi:GFA family protein [bacterium]|nr:MAG: GFA family protein [bacterium]